MATILLAEDEAAVRQFVTRALSMQGHEITAVGDGQQALETLRQRRFDMLLSDVVMPGMDGFALCRVAAREYPAMPILLMTGYSADREKLDDLQGVEAEIITKPFTLQSLSRSVDGMLTTSAAPGADTPEAASPC